MEQREKKNNFTMKNPDKHYLSQMIMVSIHNEISMFIVRTLNITKVAFCLCVFFPKSHNSSFTMKKTPDKSQLRGLLQKYLDSWKLPRSSKTRTVWETVIDHRLMIKYHNYLLFDPKVSSLYKKINKLAIQWMFENYHYYKQAVRKSLIHWSLS